ncbi:MAG TPA: ribosome small subunit-dependent GTPase A [Candidatus Sulfomarinibacteraceae bacterium]|nr:ribosome small subunit-dependent GTPase A [Candidatus Sulfomarinibacteraceae bacterium]
MAALPMPRPDLAGLGWDERLRLLFATHAAAGHVPGRVVTEDRGSYGVLTGLAELRATLSGRFRFEADDPTEPSHPAVGDWVAIQAAGGSGAGVIRAVLPRRSAIVRRAPGDRGVDAQVIAANVDVAFLVTSLNAEFNVRRLERYVAVAWESGALPVILLSKSDIATDAQGARLAAEAAAPGVPVVVVSAVTGEGLDEVRAHVQPGRTVVFVGSSGVGKSTLVNAIAGAPLLSTAGIREDDARGRHTTSRRQLVPLVGGLLIDTPGMRELGLHDGDGLGAAFGDLERVAATCRFGDCRHDSEPGCAVRVALESGGLDPARLSAFRKLEREARRAELSTDALARRAERRRWTAISRSVERHMQQKYGGER